MFLLLCKKLQFVTNVLHVSGVEGREAESGGEDDHLEVRFAGTEEGIEIEIGSETGIEIGKETGTERGRENEEPGVKEERPRKGKVCFRRDM